jgi:adenosine deaminase
MTGDLAAFVRSLPKAELHLHIEGTLEPEMMFALAARNGVELPFASVEAVRAAYQFSNLQDFLDIYYRGADVLRTEEDFHDLMAAYLARARADGVKRAEVFFDPQIHLSRGVGFEVFLPGFLAAIEAASPEISVGMIMCFLRHLPEADALNTLDLAAPYLDQILAVGLDSSEVGHPPSKFERAFARAREAGLRAVAHGGEEGPPEYVWEAIDLLGAERIDHGVRSLEDQALVDRLATDRIPLTVCPLSNIRLQVFERLEDHVLGKMLDAGLSVSINADDPAYFGGYIGENYERVAAALGLESSAIAGIAAASIEASFLPDDEKAALIAPL